MNRPQLQTLAEDRVLEAQTLLDAGHWSGAYYLVGYAVECGLKACVLVHVERTGIIFQERRFSEKCWTHDAEELVRLAGLDLELKIALSRNPMLKLNWEIVIEWNESARYQSWTEAQARVQFEAVTNPADGVLPWIRDHW